MRASRLRAILGSAGHARLRCQGREVSDVSTTAYAGHGSGDRGSAHPMLDTGFPRADAENDFLRARRRQFRAALARRLRGRPAGTGRLVPLDEITGSLGWRGQRQLGLQTIRLNTIAGTTGPRRDFDRCFRPTSSRVRSRWERLALAQRRGEAIPPIEVYRLGGLHFVDDGHHRVSIAAAAGQQQIDAYVTQLLTTAPPLAATASPPGCWRS